MTTRISSCCKEMENAIDEEAVLFIAKFREWGIPVPDGGSSFLALQFCPWCGVKLPSSLRDAWFDKAEELDIDPPYEDMPAEYHSEKWWANG